MAVTIMTIVLAVAFLAAGLTKLLGAAGPTEQVTRLGHSAGLARAVGAVETLAAAALGWGIVDTRGVIVGCALVIVVMIGALHGHLVRAKDPIGRWAPAASLLILAAVLMGMTLGA